MTKTEEVDNSVDITVGTYGNIVEASFLIDFLKFMVSAPHVSKITISGKVKA